MNFGKACYVSIAGLFLCLFTNKVWRTLVCQKRSRQSSKTAVEVLGQRVRIDNFKPVVVTILAGIDVSLGGKKIQMRM